MACGLWHGANWNYVVWGAYNAFFLTLDRLFLLKWLRASGPLIATAVTFLIINVGIVFFRATSIGQIGSYFGLVPCQDASADRNRLGHITKDGPPVMRKLLCEATWTAIKKCPRFKQFFEQVMGGKPERKKIALVAAMHRMIKVMGAMLRSGEAYDDGAR